MEFTTSLPNALQDLQRALVDRLGDNLIALILYGSAARDLFQPGFSDVNLLLVLDRADAPALDTLRVAFGPFADPWRLAPYLVTRAEWPRVVQAFPTRILEMQRGYQVLIGPDFLKEAQVDRPALAVRTQQELLNVLMRFRHRLLGAHDPAALEADLRASLPAFIKVLRTLLYLRSGTHLDDRAQVVHAAAEAYGFSEAAFNQLLEWRQGRVVLQDSEWETATRTFLATLAAVAGASHG
jgi:hypothetical protein